VTTIFCVANQKGGVAKTTSAVTIGHGLALRGYRVLIVDLDSQGNVADSLGLAPGSDLHDLLLPFAVPSLPQKMLSDVATPTGRDYLDVVRSDKHTAALKDSLTGIMKREYALSKTLRHADYDLIILDCAPSVDLMQTNALVAADYLLIPSRLEQLSLKGIKDAITSLRYLRQEEMTHCRLGGIIPTFYERVTKETHQQLVHLAKVFQKNLWPPVPLDTQCREATRRGKTLCEHAPDTRALQGYQSQPGQTTGGYREVMNRIEELV